MTPETLHDTMGLTRIITLDPVGRAQIEYAATMAQCHSGGVVQGGFVTGWIDAAMAHAVIAKMGNDAVPMTLELKVSFFAPARPGPVIAEAWLVKAGRKTVFAEGTLSDGQGTVLAKASSTLMMADRRKVEAAALAATSA